LTRYLDITYTQAFPNLGMGFDAVLPLIYASLRHKLITESDHFARA
jgi:hypothetical protein